jgi:UDP-N-acetyl-D-mannosaminuronate dehydrogenase
MSVDMKRYTKYWAGEKPRLFIKQMKRCGVPVKPWTDSTRSLELAKLLLDVVYYGWLIIFAQHVKMVADRFAVDEKKLWRFTDEIHRFLGNRPRMFSGRGIGGHCIMQDKNLLNDPFLNMVFNHDKTYRRSLNAR